MYKEEQIIPHPYTYRPARAVKENGTIRWFDMLTGNELPPYFGYGDDAQEKVDAWYKERGIIIKDKQTNNKIKEFAVNSEVCYLGTNNKIYYNNCSKDNPEAYLKEFVKLIVQECVVIAETYDKLLDEDDKECFICRKVAWKIADKLKSEFGIE